MQLTIEPQPVEPDALELAVEATKLEVDVFGACLSFGEDSCGAFCAESEFIRTETRFSLTANVGASAAAQHRSDVIRCALGTTPTEALAILERTHFQRIGADHPIEGATYATWPHPWACVAVEVRTLEDEVLMLDARCVDLPEDDDFGRATQERLAAENTSPDAPASEDSEGGCQSAPGGGGWWSLALLGLLRRRR